MNERTSSQDATEAKSTEVIHAAVVMTDAQATDAAVTDEHQSNRKSIWGGEGSQ